MDVSGRGRSDLRRGAPLLGEKSESEVHGPKANGVPVLERFRLCDLLPPQIGAVLTAEVLDGRGALRDHDARVPTGDAFGGDADAGEVVAAEDRFPLPEGNRAAVPEQSPAG